MTTISIISAVILIFVCWSIHVWKRRGKFPFCFLLSAVRLQLFRVWGLWLPGVKGGWTQLLAELVHWDDAQHVTRFLLIHKGGVLLRRAVPGLGIHLLTCPSFGFRCLHPLERCLVEKDGGNILSPNSRVPPSCFHFPGSLPLTSQHPGEHAASNYKT
jgi:hypothetical protein